MPLNYKEYLLTKLGEEGSEITHRVMKTLEFGLKEIQPGQPFTNAERIEQEVIDTFAMYVACVDDHILPYIPMEVFWRRVREKQGRVKSFLPLSRSTGALVDNPFPPELRKGEVDVTKEAATETAEAPCAANEPPW